jgi:ATP-dependent helicase Lhr and Lhr-like helicase
VVDFVATGGYALRTYDRFARIVRTPDGRWKVRNQHIAQRHRMNVGAIVSAGTLNVRVASRRGGGLAPVGRRAARSARPRNGISNS